MSRSKAAFLRQLKRLLALQRALSARIDSHLPRHLRIDGMTDYTQQVLPAQLAPGLRVCDMGGGKRPSIDITTKRRLGLYTIGLDIDPAELAAAPPGAYDETIVSDISVVRRELDADLVIASAVLEHVFDIEGAFDAIACSLRTDGRAALFVPSRNAPFARLNLILPKRLTRVLLELVRGQQNDTEGFTAYYRRCTPRDFESMANARGLDIEEERLYYLSSYFFSFVPAYLLWRAWLLIFSLIDPRQSAESFVMVLRKRATLEG